METSSGLKPINQLLDLQFFIPSYQRGYRWEAQQVRELLQDIGDFPPGGQGDFYCLQPVVVTPCKHERCEGKANAYEVIDGQQRLTTIYLILKALESREKRFEIHYATRQKSRDFLQDQLSNIELVELPTDKKEEKETRKTAWEGFRKKSEGEDQVEDNIDFFHMFQAYLTIQNWFKGRNKDEKDTFKETLLASTKVIWYQPSGDESGAALFDRINRGKIPLTNAELIKALFMQEAKGGLTDLKQLEIALTWDQMEYALWEPDFWYFLNSTLSSYHLG